METERGSFLTKKHESFENLIPLLKNEHNRRESSSQYATTKEPDRPKRYNKEPVGDLSCKKSIHEQNLDLVINVELQRKQKGHYIDAYYTDLDLHGRKLYHETISKNKPNKTKYTDLSLLFTKDLVKKNKKRHAFDIDNDTSSQDQRNKFDSNLRMTISKSNNKVYKCGLSDQDRVFSKPTDKLLKNWLPFHYQSIPKKVVHGKQYKIIKDELNETPLTSTQFHRIKSKHEKLNKVQVGPSSNETPRQHNLTVRPLPLDACNKRFRALNNTLIKSTETPCIKTCIKHSKDSIEGGGVSLSDSQLDSQRVKTKYKESYRKQLLTSTERSIKSSFKSGFTKPYQSYNNQTEDAVSIQPCICVLADSRRHGEHVYHHQINNGLTTVTFQKNSSVSETISSTAITENKFIKFSDISYMNQKYHREMQNSFPEKENVSSIFKMNNSVINFDLDINVLNNVCSNIQHTDYFKKDSNSCSQIDNVNTNAVTLNNSEELKKKIVEVIFPVKSLRKCVDIKTSKSSEECYATDISSGDKGSGNSKIEVEITEKTVIKNTEIIKEELLSRDDNPILTKKSSRSFNIQLFKSTFITKTDCSVTNNSEVKDDTPMKAILNSDDFKIVVLNIIEDYLKNNYLKDDNFDVIIVPKKNDLNENSNAMEALKKVINNSCHSDQDSDYNVDFPDLSSFNPRDYKGHEIKYDRHRYSESPMRSNKIPKKKSLRYERTKRRIASNAPNRNGKPMETMDTDVDEMNKELNKYLSMPVVKLKSIKEISHQHTRIPYMIPKPKESILKERSRDETRCLGNAKGEQCTSTRDRRIPFNDPKHETAPNKSLKLEQQNTTKKRPEFFEEFDEFKKVFDTVESKHNELIHTFDYDPCGVLFKFTKDNIVTKPKRQINIG